MKISRLQYEYRSNASKLHKKVGDLLRKSLFKNNKIYQEYPVNKINPNFPSGREKFDWYIKDLNLIIEVHGEQHYKPVCFGGISEEEANLKFKRQKVKDALKYDAAINANTRYIIIKYDEDINEELLAKKILNYDTSLEDEMSYEIPLKDLEKFEEECKTRKDKRREQMVYRKLASERRKAIRKAYKSSEKYKNQLEKAKQIRKKAYQHAKRKQTEYRERIKIQRQNRISKKQARAA